LLDALVWASSVVPLLFTLQGAHAAAVVYDITNPESFEKAKYWIGELQKNASGSIGVLLVGREQEGIAAGGTHTPPSTGPCCCPCCCQGSAIELDP